MIKSKKAFVFTFLVFFIAVVIFAYIELEIGNNDYNKNDDFIESRIGSIDSEMNYFKKAYLKKTSGFVFYNVVNELVLYENKSSVLNGNYSRLNQLIKEGVINGTFQGNNIANLDGKNLTFFLNTYKDSFDEKYYANFTYDILDVNVYEKNSYYLGLQILMNISIVTKDNISVWNMSENFFVDVPVVDLIQPDILYNSNKIIATKSAENYLPLDDWNYINLNETIDRMYGSVFFNGNYKYTIGKSYLQRVLNLSFSSYDGVVAFFSFDYDIEQGDVYDTTANFNINYRGLNSYLLNSFDNGSIVSLEVLNLADKNINGSLINGVDCEYYGVNGDYGCNFDGKDDYIEFSNESFNLNFTNSFAISLWFNPRDIVDSSGDLSSLFRYGSGDNLIDVSFNSDEKVVVKLAKHSNLSESLEFKSLNNVSFDQWNHLVFNFDGDSSIGLIYLNGILENKLDMYKDHQKLGLIQQSDVNITLGGVNDENSFNGTIDEFAIYGYKLDNVEIADLFEARKVLFLDYVDTLNGKGIEFTNRENRVKLSTQKSISLDDNYSIEFWFNPSLDNLNVSDNLVLLKLLGSSNNLTFVMNKTGNLSVGLENDLINSLSLDLIFDDLIYISVLKEDLDVYLYLNGNLKDELNGVNLGIGDLESIEIGYGDLNNSFLGIYDELKIYNRTIDSLEINRNYRNYRSFAKGCCNYILPINPQKLGYNESIYKNNVSYSSKIFYEYYNLAQDWNLTLYSLENITSINTNENYYNFLFDSCMRDMYKISDYKGMSEDKVDMDIVKINGIDDGSCEELIRLGVY